MVNIKIEGLSPDYLDSLLQKDPVKLLEVMSGFTERKYHIKQLGIDRNTFLHWEKQGLIPYQREEVGWRKFSFLECGWLFSILKFRNLGLSLETIRLIKEVLFDTAGKQLKPHFYEAAKASPDYQGKSEILAAYENKEVTDADFDQAISESQMNIFGLLALSCILTKESHCIMIDSEKNMQIVILRSPNQKRHGKTVEEEDTPMPSSFVLVNIWHVILELCARPTIKMEREALFQILSPVEWLIVRYLRTGHYSHITIRSKGGTATHLKLRKEEVTPEVIEKLRPVLKKGKFEDMELKQRDGKIIAYSQTQILKLSQE